MKISYSIMAVPERKEYVDELLKELGSVPVAWENGSGIWDTRCRAMMMRPDDSTHHVVIQDDAVLCKDFKSKVEEYVSNYPDCAISLYLGSRDTKKFRDVVLPKINYAVLNELDIVDYSWLSWGVGLVLPTGFINDIVLFWDKKDKWLRHDDSRIGVYLNKHNVKLVYSFPSLVDHREGVSAIESDKSVKKRHAYKFIGKK